MKDQIQFETNGLTVLAINIAPDASEIRILDKDENYCKKGDLVYKTSQNVWGQGDHVLPDGKWKLHAVTDSMTDEQAKVLCPFVTETDYHDYDGPESYEVYYDGAENAIEGLQLFLFHEHGIYPAEKLVLLVCE